MLKVTLQFIHILIAQTYTTPSFLPFCDTPNNVGEINCFLKRVFLQNGKALVTGAESRVTLRHRERTTTIQHYKNYTKGIRRSYQPHRLYPNQLLQIAPLLLPSPVTAIDSQQITLIRLPVEAFLKVIIRLSYCLRASLHRNLLTIFPLCVKK